MDYDSDLFSLFNEQNTENETCEIDDCIHKIQILKR